MDSTDVNNSIAFGERLRSERNRLGLAQAEFGAKVGVSKTSQFNYEAGDRSPDAEYLVRAAALGVDVTYVLTGQHLDTPDDFVIIPQHDVAASAGPGAVNGGEKINGGLSFSRRWLSKRGLHPSALRVIDVVGESMQPRLHDGDKVLVDVSDTSPKSGRVYVLRQGDELLVKHCQLLPNAVLRVSSANPDYPTYDIDLSKAGDVTIVGRVRASTHEW